MKIQNETDVQTRALRALILAVAKREGYDDRDYLRRLTVRVRTGVHRHRGRATVARIVKDERGAARFFGVWIDLWIPRAEKVDPALFASVIRHEMAHNFGHRHRQMPNAVQYCAPIEWAASFALPRIVRSAAARPTDGSKLAHAEAMRARAATRAKRAATLLRKWTVKVRYYERKLAAGTAAESRVEAEKVTS